MQQALFDIEHYKLVIQYHEERARHHIREANEYAKDAKVAFNVQLKLAYPLPDDEAAA
jgi:hypothetical protein